MKKFLLVLLLYIPSLGFAQSKFLMAEDANFYVIQPNGTTEAYQIKEVSNKTATELYADYLSAISSIYNSPKDVVDKVEGRIIIVKGFASKAATSFAGNINGRIPLSFSYRLEFKFKDGKVKIEAPKVYGMKSTFMGRDLNLKDEALLNYYYEDVTAITEITVYLNNTINDIITMADKVNNW